ncbi:hypothetical protein BGZ57DRAFT_858506 [Hyaloscypha finlandica]|nr:hypothetical protein BGZ57DRAFT_858506 [Hyaloscypha finlandica]
MKFSHIFTAVVIALSGHTQAVPGAGHTKYADSELFPGWRYELDAAAPTIKTLDEAHNLSNAYNNTVGVDKINGKYLVIDHAQKKQVATIDGDLAEAAESNYPSHFVGTNSTVITSAMEKVDHYLAHGTFPEAGVAANTLDERGNK